MPDGFQVISSRLLVADVRVDRGVPSCTSQVLTISEGDVFSVLGLVAFGQTEINNVDSIFGLLSTTD